jgi:hypothetical protein
MVAYQIKPIAPQPTAQSEGNQPQPFRRSNPMTCATHSHKQFKDLKEGDRFLAYATPKNYSAAKSWATASGSPIAISESLYKIPVTTGRNAYGHPADFVEFKAY